MAWRVQRARCNVAAFSIKRSVLRQRLQFEIRVSPSHDAASKARGSGVSALSDAGGMAAEECTLAGCAELLLVRRPVRPVPADRGCRFCLADDDEATL